MDLSSKPIASAISRADLDEVITRHILYVVVLPKEGSGKFSPFQGFSLNALSIAGTIDYLCTLPTSIDELYRSKKDAVRWRSIGLSGYAIVLVELDFLPRFRGGLPLTCFVSDQQSFEEVERHIAKHGRKQWLHLTTDEANSSVPKLWNFSRADIWAWAQKTAQAVITENLAGAQAPTAIPWRSFVEWPEETAHIETQSHNVTRPTEMALRSLNFKLAESNKSLALRDDNEFAFAISTAADEVERVRHDSEADHHRIPGSPVLIVTVPSVYRRLSPHLLNRNATRAVRRAFRNIIRQRQYIAMKSSGAEAKEMLEDRDAVALMAIRAEELGAYTSALSVAASSFVAPVLRCPPQVDRVRDLLIRLAGAGRSKNPNLQRLNRLAHMVGDSIRGAIPQMLLQRIEKHQHDGIKLIGDTPLELLPVGGLPLGLRATVSRMPTLPGNLLIRQGLLRTPLLIQPNELRKVLIVRAFDHDDPLRNVLVDAIKIANRHEENIDISVADVATREQFIQAFDNFDGCLAIFDGHGSHDRTDPQGTIRLGSIQINPFELYSQMKIPPILFLSACETHPLEGIESSVASAFLMMGARSVLGTIVPIDGLNAGALMARFALRFSNFVPLLKTMISWPQVVSGMLRMSYVTDVLRAMQKQITLKKDDYMRIHTEANITINSFRSEWFEELLASLAATTSQHEDQIREMWRRTCYFTDTLHYVHLGQPEHIFVVPDES